MQELAHIRAQVIIGVLKFRLWEGEVKIKGAFLVEYGSEGVLTPSALQTVVASEHFGINHQGLPLELRVFTVK